MPFLQSANKTDYLNPCRKVYSGPENQVYPTTKVECIMSLPGVILKPYNLEILESKNFLFSF